MSYDSRRSSGGGGGGSSSYRGQLESHRGGGGDVRSLTCQVLGYDDKYVEIFPDELPSGSDDVLNLLKSELAPLDKWLEWATEYYRQDQPDEFEEILKYVLTNKDIVKQSIYKDDSEEFGKRCMEIYTTLAAKKLKDFQECTTAGNTEGAKDCQKKIASYLKEAENSIRGSALYKSNYSFVIKGFYGLCNSDLVSATSNFRQALESTKSEKSTSETNNEIIEHISRVGIACILYNQKEFAGAYKELSIALDRHPGCGVGVRIAIAVCCFHLKDYTTSKNALKRALELDPGNANIYTLMSLIELVDAQKIDNKSTRDVHLNRSYEYSLLASSIDPSNLIAQNQVANNMLHSWKPYPCSCIIKSGSQLVLPLFEQFEIAANDLIRIDDCKQAIAVDNVIIIRSTFDKRIQEYLSFFDPSCDAFMIINISPKTLISSESMDSLKRDSPNALHQLWAKDISAAINIAGEVINSTSNPAIRSESYYIVGKANHMRNQITQAIVQYELSVQSNSDMALAKFELAKLAFSQNQMSKALEYCTQLLVVYPTDKDTNALMYLINSITTEKIYDIPLLFSTVVGSMYEFDLWLKQATLRQKDKGDGANALKCYEYAAKCANHCRRAVSINVSNNMIVLNHELGQSTLAFELAKRTLKANNNSNLTSYGMNFKNFEFEGIFYEWETLSYPVDARYEAETGRIYVTIDADAMGTDASSSFATDFHAGDDVVIGDMAFEVESVSSVKEMVVRHRIRGLHVDSASSDNQIFDVKKRNNYSNFNEYTLATVFNMARVMENIGKVEASSELYLHILNVQPTFIECYLRLSKICKDRGQNDKALEWLVKAMSFASDNTSMVEDIQACIGDLHFRNGKWEEAKKAYESGVKSKNDARSMLGLGNVYFANILPKPEFIKDSYKFFHHVADKLDRSNVYAAHGLSMVVAEKGHLEAANSMMSKLRDDAPSNNDIQSNLGNVLMKQGRYRDAEGCYITSLKSESNKLQSDKLNQRYECTVLCLIKRGEIAEAMKLLLCQIHLDPSGVARAWYNLAIVLQMLAKASIRSGDSKSIENSIQSMGFALRIVSILNTEFVSLNCRKASIERDKLKQLKDSCHELNQKCIYEFSKVQAKRSEQQKIFEESKRNLVSSNSVMAPQPSTSAIFITKNSAQSAPAVSAKSIFGDDDDDDDVVVDDGKASMRIDDIDVDDYMNLAGSATSGSKNGEDKDKNQDDMDAIFAAGGDSDAEEAAGNAGSKRKAQNDGEGGSVDDEGDEVDGGDANAKMAAKKVKGKAAAIVESDDDDIF